MLIGEHQLPANAEVTCITIKDNKIVVIGRQAGDGIYVYLCASHKIKKLISAIA